MVRIKSSWNMNVGLIAIEGLIGQYGSELPVAYAAHASVTHSRSWHQPSTTRGCATRRASSAPTVLPMPRPTRNTARINEKVYAVAPNKSDSSRVHTTSAPSADMPDKAIAT